MAPIIFYSWSKQQWKQKLAIMTRQDDFKYDTPFDLSVSEIHTFYKLFRYT